MSVEFVTLVILTIGYTYFEKKVYKTFMAPTTILVWPYIFVIFIILTVGPTYGYYTISPSNILLIGLGTSCFFAGSIVSRMLRERVKFKFKAADIQKRHSKRKELISDITIKNGARYVIFIEIVIALRYIGVFFQHGLSRYIASSGYNGIMTSGACAHLMFSMFPFIPVLFYESIYKKRRDLLTVVAIAYIEVFLTYTKYHIILLIVASLMYLVIRDKSQIRIIVPLLIAIPMLLFFINYIFNFASQGSTASWTFLWNHFFNYLLGGVAYTSMAPDSISISGLTLFDIIFSQIRTLPNMFTSSLFGYTIGKPLNIPTIPMSGTGETGNVVAVLCLVYSTKEYVGASCYLFILGASVSFVTNLTKQVLLKTFIFSIAFLSFYSSYLQLVAPWEVFVCSVLLPALFSKKLSLGNRKII